MNRTTLIGLAAIFTFSLLLTGCLDRNGDNKSKEPNATHTNITEVKESPTPTKAAETPGNTNISELKETEKKSFSYLEQLSEARLKEYELFVSDKNYIHLQSFSPEEIMLVYMNAVAYGDTDIIYPLTYNNGLLADPDTFRQEYYDFLMNPDHDVAVRFRFYDSIEVVEETAKEDALAVTMTVSVGTFTDKVAYGLKKEDGIWKMELQHLIEHYKSASKK